jgi:hypothetical protein
LWEIFNWTARWKCNVCCLLAYHIMLAWIQRS